MAPADMSWLVLTEMTTMPTPPHSQLGFPFLFQDLHAARDALNHFARYAVCWTVEADVDCVALEVTLHVQLHRQNVVARERDPL